jgi:hypothetical protein
MGYRPLTFTKIPGSGGAYLWNAAPGTFANGAVINQWIDPVHPPANAANNEIVTPEGRARVAVRATALGGGIYRYDYAVMNVDFARAQIDAAHPREPNLHVLSSDGFAAFSVPVSSAATLGNVEFADADQDAGNDWIVTQSASGVRWQAPAGHPLNWGTLYRFSFTADRAPVGASGWLDVATSGSPAAYAAATLAPLDDVIFRDSFDGG